MPQSPAGTLSGPAEAPVSTIDAWRPRARLARMRSSHDYGIVILLIVGIFAFIAATPEEKWANSAVTVLVATTFLVTLWTAGFGKGVLLATPVAALALIVAAAVLIAATDATQGMGAITNSVLVAATMTAVALGISDQRQVNIKSISGALCFYLLIGLLFAFIYNAIALLGNSPFFSNGGDGTDFERLYFSYVTLATLGYGDYTAGTTLGRSLAVGEVLLGQLFLVTAVALIVGLMVTNRGGNNGGGQGDDTTG